MGLLGVYCFGEGQKLLTHASVKSFVVAKTARVLIKS